MAGMRGLHNDRRTAYRKANLAVYVDVTCKALMSVHRQSPNDAMLASIADLNLRLHAPAAGHLAL